MTLFPTCLVKSRELAERDLYGEFTQLWNGCSKRDPNTCDEHSRDDNMKQCQQTEATVKQTHLILM